MCPAYSQGTQNTYKPPCTHQILENTHMEGTRGKSVNYMYSAVRRRAHLKTNFFSKPLSSFINIHVLFLHVHYVKACYFQPCPTNNLGNLLGIHFSTVWYIQTNEISAKSVKWELVAALLLQVSCRKEGGQRRNLPKCPNSREDQHEEHTP